MVEHSVCIREVRGSNPLRSTLIHLYLRMSIIKTDNPQELGNLLSKHFSENKIYLEALDVVKKNSSGKVWLIGSGVYKTLLNLLYRSSYEVKDWDFIVGKVTKPLKLKNGWVAGETKHGNPKLKKGCFVIDLIALDNIHSIKERNLEPDIRHYLSGVPLTIQSIVFSVDGNFLMGDVGIKSLLTKTVGINNGGEYDYEKGVHGDLYTTKRYADILGFKEV